MRNFLKQPTRNSLLKTQNNAHTHTKKTHAENIKCCSLKSVTTHPPNELHKLSMGSKSKVCLPFLLKDFQHLFAPGVGKTNHPLHIAPATLDPSTRRKPPRRIGRSVLTFLLVGGFNPFEKYARQNGNLPQIGVKTKHI